MGMCRILKLYSTLPVCFDKVLLDLRFAVYTPAYDSIVRAGVDVVADHEGVGLEFIHWACAFDHDAIEVALLNSISIDQRRVINNLNANFVYLQSIQAYKPFYGIGDDDTNIFASHKDILDDYWFASNSLDEHACKMTRDHGILSKDKVTVLIQISHNTTTFEIVELTILYDAVGVVHVDSNRDILLWATSSELAVTDLGSCVWPLVDAPSSSVEGGFN